MSNQLIYPLPQPATPCVAVPQGQQAVDVFSQQRQFVEQFRTQKEMGKIVTGAHSARCNAESRFRLDNMLASLGESHALPPGGVPSCQDVVLPPSLWGAAHNIARLSGGASTMAAVIAVLAAISIAARGRYRVFNETTNHSEALILFALMLAPSGTRKSVLIGNIQKPFSRFEDEMAARGHWDSDESNPPPRLFANVGSGPQIAKIMAAQGECVSVLGAEGDMLLETLCKSPGFASLFMRAHGMEPYIYDSGRQGHIALKNPAMPMLMFVQPAILLSLFRKKSLVETGGIARFIPFIDDLNSYTFCSSQGCEDGWAAYENRISRMLTRNFTQESGRKIWTLCLDPHASQRLCCYEETVKQRLQLSPSEVLGQFTSKLHGTAARLAGLLHLWRHSDRPESNMICDEDMLFAITLADFLHQHAAIAFTPEHYGAPQNAMKVIRWLQARPENGPFQIADVCRSVRDEAIGKNMTVTSAQYALGILLQSNFIALGLMPNGCPGYIARSNIMAYHV